VGDLGRVLDAPSGAAEVVELLDRLGVPIDATAAVAMGALKDAGLGRRKQAVLAGLRTRRERNAERNVMADGSPQVTAPAGTAGNRSGTTTAPMVPDDAWLSRVAQQLLEKDRDKRPSWYNDPAEFVRTCIMWEDGESPASYQLEILSALPEHRRVSCRGPHALGKTALASWALLWFGLSRELAQEDWRVMSTAGSWRQLTSFMWPEVAQWARRLRWDAIGREPFSRDELMLTSLRLAHGQAFAGASDNAELLEGLHSSQVLVLFDESKSIPAPVWESLEGALAGRGTALALATSTPGSPAGTFYDIHSRKVGYEDWACFHVRLEDAISAGRIAPSWAAARARQWGVTSAVYKNRVEGEFASSDEDSTIPLEWIEAAVDRWEQWKASGEDAGPVAVVGVDVARMGADSTVLALRAGDIITELRRYSHAATTETTGRVVAVLESHPGAKAVVDVIGVGAGVTDMLREQGYKRTVAFNASAGTARKDRSGELGFINARASAWWALREALDPAFDPTIALPPDDELIGDLSAPRYLVTSAGKIQVESKDEIRKRLGRSTDAGDAVVQACFDAQRGIGSQFLDWMLAKKAAQDVAPPTPSPSQMVQLQASVIGGFSTPARRCPPGQHRFFGGGACALCGRTPEEVV